MKTGTIERFPLLALLFGALFLAGCGGDDSPDQPGARPKAMAVTLDKTYTGPQVDESVTAENGGVGFEEVAEELGWETNTVEESRYFQYYASKEAQKGGELISAQQDFPAVIRPYGKDANTTTISLIEALNYESMTQMDPLTLELLPALATHWKVGEDGQTYFFRINPQARFSDGHPVTTEDVLATHALLSDKTILDPYANFQYGEQFEAPKAVSPYIFSIRSVEKNWKNMRIYGGMSILPAHVIGDMDGTTFLEKFKYDLPPGSGPYTVLKEDINPQNTLSLTRLEDWWRKDDPLVQGQYNFDKITFKTIIDPSAQVQEFLAGNIDFYYVNRAQWWKEKFNSDVFDRGIAKKRKIYNDNPQGLQGWAFNTRKAPFNDPRVREAFTLLIPRQKLIDKIMAGEYIISDSYFPGSPYENPNNPERRYNPQRAVELLKEAGYTSRNDEGILVHEQTGKPFEIELPLTEGSDHIMQPLVQELQKAGIRMTLRPVDFAQRVKLGNERKFDVLYVSYATSVFPHPYSMLHSSMADQNETINLTGFNNPRADALIEKELLSFDQDERVSLLQELDSIFMAEQHYALAWYAPFTRLVYWSYLGHPDFYISKVGDYRDVYVYWWYDESKVEQVRKGRSDKSITMETSDDVEVLFWPNFNKSQEPAATGS